MGSSLLPALFCFRPEVAVSAFTTFGRIFRVSGVAAHTDRLVQQSALSLFEACHLISSGQPNIAHIFKCSFFYTMKKIRCVIRPIPVDPTRQFHPCKESFLLTYGSI